MKSVTITFAVLLIILIIFVFNSWKFRVWCHWFRAWALKAAFTHGLSILLIVSFSQCASVSFLILFPTQLNHVGVRHTIPVVFFSGNLHPFVGKHLKYTNPAVLFLLLLVILPILWLLSYPLLFKMLGIFHLSETKFSVHYINITMQICLYTTCLHSYSYACTPLGCHFTSVKTNLCLAVWQKNYLVHEPNLDPVLHNNCYFMLIDKG